MNPYEIFPSARRSKQFELQQQKPAEPTIQEMFDEVSSSESDVYKALYAYGQNPDPIARAKGLYVYRDMLEDDQVKACVQLRIQARLSTPWMIHSAEEGNARADEYAEFIDYALKGLRGTFADNLYNIYSAISYGFSITEKVLKIYESGPFAGKIGLAALKTREPFNYDFKTDQHGNLLGIVYTGAGNSLIDQLRNERRGAQTSDKTAAKNGATQVAIDDKQLTPVFPNTPSYQGVLGSNANPYPIEKFVVYSYNMEFSNWYGRSELFSAFRSWQIKKHVMKFWNIWLERYAAPFLWAQYKRDVGIKKQALEEIDGFMKNLSVKNAIRTSDAITIQAIQSSSSAADAYEKAIEAHNRYISHALLCPNLMGITGNQGDGKGGSYALGKKQFDSFVWTLEKLGRDTSETIVGEQIIKPLILLNFPDVDEKLMPRFTFESVEEDNIKARTDILVALKGSGFVNADEAWVREWLSLPKMEDDVELLDPTAERKVDENGDPIEDDPEEGEEEKAEEKKEEKAEEKKEEDPPAKKESESRKESTLHAKFGERVTTRFEKKIRVKEYAAQFDSVEGKIIDALTPVLIDIRDALIKQVQKKGIISEGNVKSVETVSVNIGDFKKTLRMWLTKVHLDSKLRAVEELARAGVDVEIVTKFAEAPSYGWEPVPPAEAIDFFNRKVSVKVRNKAGKLVPIDLATGKELALYDQRAFMISGVVKENILNDAKNIILNGIKRQDEPGAIGDLKDLFNKYVQQGIMKDDELIDPHRLETIVRTNMNEAINEGRRSMYEAPDVAGFVPYFAYSAIIDEKVTDYCECMDGKNFRIEDLAAINPPAHFNSVVKGTEILTIDGIKKIEDVKPDDFVLTHRNRWRRVYVTMSKKNDLKSFREIKNSTGRTLRVTEEHPVLTVGGWKAAADLKIGDKVFQSIQESDGIFNGVMAHPENFPSLFDQPSVSFDVVNFSNHTLMGFPIELDGDFVIRKSKVNDVSSNYKLEIKRDAAHRDESEEDRFIKSGFISQFERQGMTHFNNGASFPHGVADKHASGMGVVNIASFLSHSERPMIFSGRPGSGRICDRCLKPYISDGNGVYFTPIGNYSFSKAKTAFNGTNRFSAFPMPGHDEFFDKVPVFKLGIDSHKSSWIESAIISIVDVNYNGDVYNIGVEEDETYAAENIIVHNCRSFTVPITQIEIDDMAASGEGVEISEPCLDRAAGFSDTKREPTYVPKGVENLRIIPKEEMPVSEIPAPKKAIDIQLDQELKEMLSQIIVKCPYTICASSDIVMTGQNMNVGIFKCSKCTLPFKVSNKGDLYLYDAGLDKWERSSMGLFPSYFKKKG